MQAELLVAVLLLGTGYFAFMFWASLGFRRSCRQPPANPHPVSISVLIPARNEAEHIERCLRSVLASNYPTHLWEVIVIDDGSTDETSLALAKFAASRSDDDVSFRFLNHQVAKGKIAALRTGVSESRMAWVLSTDADCVVGPDWLSTMAACTSETTGAVAGPVLYRANGSFLQRFQALEALGLVAVGAGTIAQGLPTICNSANLAFDRDVLVRLQALSEGPELAPGHDESMIQLVKEVSGKSVSFCASTAAAVETGTHGGFVDFLRQRIRWVSMGMRYPNKLVVAISLLIFAFYLLTLVCITVGCWKSEILYAGLVGLAIKAVADSVVLLPATRFYERTRWLRLLGPGEILHLPYIVAVSLLGAAGPGRWKGN